MKTDSRNNANANNNSRPLQRPTSATTYDSFQHITSSAHSQPKYQKPVFNEKKTENFSQLTSDKLYTFNEIPFDVLYDRVESVPSKSQPSSEQEGPFKSTFQPLNNFPTVPDPSRAMFTDASEKNRRQPIQITTDKNTDGMQPPNLGSIIKKIQQDYLREIHPFVSSVRFVEKNHEYGHNLDDINHMTLVDIRQSFTKQADDILQRSFRRQDHQQKLLNPHTRINYSSVDNNDNQHGFQSSNQQHRLEKYDSKQSLTSVSSISTYDSEHESQYSSLGSRKNHNTLDEATSPPRKEVKI